jgi:hypothetical protein
MERSVMSEDLFQSPDSGQENTRVHQATIALLEGESEIGLTPNQARLVIVEFPEVNRAAKKWTQMTRHGGRLLVFEPDLVAAILDFLADTDPASTKEAPNAA